MSDRFDQRHELTHKPKPDADDGGAGVHVRRIELITGPARRRQWSDDDKARIIVESLLPGANVSAVARRHGLSPQQLFGWRREARELFSADSAPTTAGATDDGTTTPPPAFASVVLVRGQEAMSSPPSPPPPASAPPASPGATASGRIEIAIGDTVVRVIGPVEPATLTAVLRAVRRAT